MVYENVGNDPAEATIQRDRKAGLMIAIDHAEVAGAAIRHCL